jgi:hypothetical protein
MLKMDSPSKISIMKKLTFYVLPALLMLLNSPALVKANIAVDPAETKAKSAILSLGSFAGSEKLKEIKPIEISELVSSERNEILQDSSPFASVQDEHSRRYMRRHSKEEVDVSVQTDNQWRGNDFSPGRHSHSVAYIGAGGLLIFILVMILLI